MEQKIAYAVDSNAPDNVHPSEWDLAEILTEIQMIFPVKAQIGVEDLEKLDRSEMKARLQKIGLAAFEAKEAEVTPDLMRVIVSQYIMLPIIDRLWVDHLYVMDALKTGIGLRGYGQKDPRVEYEKEAYEIFEDLKNNISDEAIKRVLRIQIEMQAPQEPGMDLLAPGPNPTDADYSLGASAAPGVRRDDARSQPPTASAAAVAARLTILAEKRLLGPAPGSQRQSARDPHQPR